MLIHLQFTVRLFQRRRASIFNEAVKPNAGSAFYQ